MDASTLGLLLAAAGLHTLANLLLKASRNKLAFTWWMLGVTSVLGLPCWFFTGDINATGWLLILASGLLEALYFIALSRAYTYGDLSQVYPIARGSAPLFIVLWAVLFIDERPSLWGLFGVCTVVLGIYLINLPSFAAWKQPLVHFGDTATRWALVTGCLISAYAVTDKVGVRYVHPIVYLYLFLFVTWVALGPMWLMARQRQAMLDEIRIGRMRSPMGILGAAISGVIAYLLVLIALRRAPVSYVGAVREVSVVLGAIVGVRFLGERGGAVRVFASLLIFAGIVLIATAG
jgi:drug/metabolite transporter (DMT)-like permease